MSAIIITLAIISIFSGHAKELGQSRWKWALLGLSSFWIPGFGLTFLLVQIVGDSGETWQITTITIGSLLILGGSGYFCSRILKKLKQRARLEE